MKKVSKIAVTIIISFLMISVINMNIKTKAVNNFKSLNNDNLIISDEDNQLRIFDEQDGRFIKKLEWLSPNGELPGTYEDYLKVHPLNSAFFSEPI